MAEKVPVGPAAIATKRLTVIQSPSEGGAYEVHA